MIKILNHLGINRQSNQSPLLIVTKTLKTASLVKTSFEILNVPSLYILHPAVACLYAAGIEI
jgi:actin-related protein